MLTLPVELSLPPVLSRIRVTRSLVLCVCFSIFNDILLSLILANLCVSEIRCTTGLKASNHLFIFVPVLISFLHLLQTSILLETIIAPFTLMIITLLLICYSAECVEWKTNK